MSSTHTFARLSTPNASAAAGVSGQTAGRRIVLKVILLGDTSVGKTSLMRQFVSGVFEQRYKATIGADFFNYEVTLANGMAASLQIWDTAGQERFQSLGTSFYRGADACMLVFDITSTETFSRIPMWYSQFLLQAGDGAVLLVGNKSDLSDSRNVFVSQIATMCQENGKKFVSLMPDGGNPTQDSVDPGVEAVAAGAGAGAEGDGNGKDDDADGSSTPEDNVTPHSSSAKVWPYIETSARNNVAVKDAFQAIAELAYKMKMGEQAPELPPSIQLRPASTTLDPTGEPKKKRFGCC